MAALRHLAERPVGTVAALVGALGVLIVDPREHDHFAGRVVAEEQAVTLEELRPEPMLMVVARETQGGNQLGTHLHPFHVGT